MLEHKGDVAGGLHGELQLGRPVVASNLHLAVYAREGVRLCEACLPYGNIQRQRLADDLRGWMGAAAVVPARLKAREAKDLLRGLGYALRREHQHPTGSQ